MKTSSSRTDNALLGIALMALGVLILPISDAIAKYLTIDYSPIFVSWLRYVAAAIVIVPFAFYKRGKNILPKTHIMSHSLRTFYFAAAMTFYFFAFALVPLSSALAGLFIYPAVIVVLSLIFLKEKLNLPKWVSLAFGIVGSLIILQPGKSVDTGLLLAFGAGIFFALYIMEMRRISDTSDPIQAMVFQSIFGPILTLPYLFYAGEPIGWSVLIYCAAMGVIASFGHLLILYACRYSSASSLAPIGYLELVSAAIVGYVAFGDVPTLSIIIGSIFIIAAGLIVMRASK